jgi:hypothetical protein
MHIDFFIILVYVIQEKCQSLNILKRRMVRLFIAQKKKKKSAENKYFLFSPKSQKFTGFTVSHLTSVHHTESA